MDNQNFLTIVHKIIYRLIHAFIFHAIHSNFPPPPPPKTYLQKQDTREIETKQCWKEP